MSLVCLRGVTRTVTLPDGEDLHILRGVNLDVAAGEHVSIVGRSGTGKSTMLNIIGLLDAPTSGTYELDGVDTTRLGEGRRARMRGEDFGFVFQQAHLMPTLCLLDNIVLPGYLAGLRPRPEITARGRSLMERMGIADLADNGVTEVSGGQLQRAGICRALINDPGIVFADEPTGALDTRSAAFVLAELRRLADEGAAVVLVTHDLGAAAMAETALVMRDGVIVGCRRGATPDELLTVMNRAGEAA